jgi:hypothetical protein
MCPDDSTIDYSHSVSGLIERLKRDDSQTASELWQRFFDRLLSLARARLRGSPDHSIDEHDNLISVFERFFQAVKENRFARLNDRDDLWQILCTPAGERAASDESIITLPQRKAVVELGAIPRTSRPASQKGSIL